MKTHLSNTNHFPQKPEWKLIAPVKTDVSATEKKITIYTTSPYIVSKQIITDEIRDIIGLTDLS